jgi:hypothetical protein
VIYSYNKSQRDALFLKFILVRKLYIFRIDLLSCQSSGVLIMYVFTAIFICHTSYVAVNTLLRLLMIDRQSVRNMWSSLPNKVEK